MEQHLSTHQSIGRRTRLATCLGIALALGAGPTLAASQGQAQQALMQTEAHATLIRGSVSGETGLSASPMLAPVGANSTSSVSATITVTVCSDASGAGTLRAALQNAQDGDTIDMSGLSTCTINMASSIITSVDNLTIKGVQNSDYPFLNGQNSISPLRHMANGTITLIDMTILNGRYVSNGAVARGGCLYSQGDIQLINSRVVDCVAYNMAAGIAEGGAIFSRGDTSLSHSKVVRGIAKNSGTGAAQGGAIWSQGEVTLDNGSLVDSSKSLTSGTGSARGGGIWSQGGTTITDESSVRNNRAQASGSGSALGGGVYSTGNLTVDIVGAITSNTASANNSFASGGGAHTGGSVATVKYSEIEGNVAESSKSIAQGGGLRTNNTLLTNFATIANNQATSGTSTSFGGGVASAGNVAIMNTTVSGNTAQRVGGLHLAGNNATSSLIISSSTVSGNVSTKSESGAGIYAGSDTKIMNSTITGNIERNTTDTKYGAGLSVKHDVNVDLSSTIISGNKIDTGSNPPLDSDINAASGGSNATLSGDYNLIGFTTILYPGAHNIQSLSPGLGPLDSANAINATHPLLPGSPALNAGVSNGFTTDQRGPGFKRVVGASADIGAFEYGGDDVIFAHGFDSP